MSTTSVIPSNASAPSAYKALRPVLQRFVDGVLAGEKPTDVVRRLRPKLKRPDVLASKWLALPAVKAARAELAENALENVGITTQMIVRELARIAFGDPRRLFDEKGNLRPIHELDDDAAALVAGIEIVEGRRGKRKTIVRRWDKRRALRDLAEIDGATKGTGASGGTIFNVQINL